MRVLLHIGQSKTGTSAIQGYLALNRRHLLKAGILFPSVKIGGLRVDLENHNAVADAVVGLNPYPHLKADQYFNQFLNEARHFRANLMILSAEHFFGGQPRIYNVSDESSYYERYRAKVEALTNYLRGYDVSILVYLRPQVDWLASTISHTIRIERLSGIEQIYTSDRQFYQLFKPLLRYCRLIDIWAATLKPRSIAVVPYEREFLHGGSSVADFLHRANIENLDLPLANPKIQFNESLTREYVELKKIINLDNERRTKTQERVTIKCLEYLSQKSGKGALYKLSADLIEDIKSFVAEENVRLSQRYVTGDRPLSAQSDSYRAATPEPLTEKDMVDARVAFEKEYRRLWVRFSEFDLTLRAFLRRRAKPVLAFLHQAKRVQRRVRYR